MKKKWYDEKLEKNWQTLLEIRTSVLKALEEKRATGIIGNALQAKVKIAIKNAALFDFFNSYLQQLPAIFIVSQVELKKDEALTEEMVFLIEKAEGVKCARCWNFNESVGKNTKHPDICQKCIDVI